MTFEIPAPLITFCCCFSICALLGGIAGYRARDWGEVFAGLIVGLFLGFIGVLMTQDHIEGKAAAATAKAHLETMPEDWQNLHRLLEKTESVSVKKAYVTSFLRNKTEPQITIGAYEGFGSISNFEWISEKIMPYVLIDLETAMGELE